jgi:ribonuclease G
MNLEEAEMNPFIVSALYRNHEMIEISCEKEEDTALLGNIYIGRVQNIVSNIQAAFVEIGKGVPCYYSFEDNQNPIFTHRQNDKKLSIGDEILVQVSKENIKTKAPVVTSNLNFTGKYLVLTTGNTKLGVSNKLSDKEKKSLKQLIKPFMTSEFGIVIRTNAKNAKEKEILEELQVLVKHYEKLMETAKHRTCFSILYQSPKKFLLNLRDTYSDTLASIVTDDEELYSCMESFLEDYQPRDLPKLSLYQDKLLPLSKLYSIESKIKDLLKERVWLKSGAYLVIQQTEACVVIDVNTGKFSGKKKLQETFLKINLEAAKEISRQMRLRNLTGIILIDFIDMKDKKDKEMLLNSFELELKQDPINTNLIGMTALHMVEVTRKKTKKSLREELLYECPTCHGRGYLY